MELVLIDFDGTLLNSDALPLTPPLLSQAEIADLEVSFRHTDGRAGGIVGILTSFELAMSVPEPSAFLLMLSGVAFLICFAHRRNAKSTLVSVENVWGTRAAASDSG